ncbi:hypothetical protein [Comamonas terrigena]|uniref:hypothetical protein n=1 Tax=Comamonas terrigena TaxID=32013 RepID=UPI00244D6CC7|nr:hypothetical protein [Comamonas terrigena]MDH0048446.1 hypothetical protein [Comamonas terrigena]MDH0510854.1 hypothetical protein [Comamonas terrigena]MDH1090239.1 hypothetical protein [Comamonas terrigena]MDH1499606.1 hypothetical protein [Comamonas terrigena]
MILVPTSSGRQALAVQDALFTPSMHTVFMLCDGQRSMGQVLGATAGLGATSEDVRTLLELGWLRAGTQQETAAPAMDERTASLALEHARYVEGYRWARELTTGLGLRGLRLLLAIESATDYQQLASLVPRIRDAVGAARAAVLELVLFGDVQEKTVPPSCASW